MTSLVNWGTEVSVSQSLIGLDPRWIQYIKKYSATVWHRTCFSDTSREELLELLLKTKEKVRQIVFIIAQGEHTLDKYDAHDIRWEIWEPESWEHKRNTYTPQFFWVVFPAVWDGITLQFLMPDVVLTKDIKKNIHTLTEPVKSALAMYRRLSQELLEHHYYSHEIQLGFVGSLPSVITTFARRFWLQENERIMLEQKHDVAAYYVANAVMQLTLKENLDAHSDTIVLLGANGMLGKKLFEELKKMNKLPIYPIDIENQHELNTISGRRLFVDCTLGSLEWYIECLKLGDIFLNETYDSQVESIW
jgi:hypothetical protein